MKMLSEYVLTFCQWLLAKHGEQVHKIALDAGFTCPNRDGKGHRRLHLLQQRIL